MNKKQLLIYSFIVMYLSVIPFGITKYGIINNIDGFCGGHPSHEIYSSFVAAWILGHGILWVLIYSLYMAIYGHAKE
jgi:hypothetical protein